MEMKWISCKEELPPQEGSWLLYSSNGGGWISYDKNDAEYPWKVNESFGRGVWNYTEIWLKDGDKFWLKGPSPQKTVLTCCMCNESVFKGRVSVKKGWCVCVYCYEKLEEGE